MNIKKRSLLSMILTISLVIGLFVGMPMVASAVTDGDAGAAYYENNSQPENADCEKVQWNGFTWDVVGYHKLASDGGGQKGIAGPEGTATLLLDKLSYDANTMGSSSMNFSYNVLDKFYNGLLDKSDIVTRTLIGGSTPSTSVQGYNGDTVKGADVVNQSIWQLSVLEASQLKLSVRCYSDWWHLRSPGWTETAGTGVVSSGEIDVTGMINLANAIRPALYLSLSSPVFLSKDIENIGAIIKNPTVTDSNGYTWDIVGVNYGAVKRGVDTPIGNATLLLSNESNKKFNYADGNTEINFSGYLGYYAGSDLQNTMSRVATTISGTEYTGKITPRDIIGGSESYGSVGYNSDKVAGDNITNQMVWPLSVKEAEDLDLQRRIFGDSWLLRSQDEDRVGFNGSIGRANGAAIRPALYLDLSSSIFQSLDSNWISNFVDYSQGGWGKPNPVVPIEKVYVSSIDNETYTGKAITPAISVTYNLATLIDGTDYTVAYTNNTNAGKATITLTGIGNYTGTTTANFDILPASVSVYNVAPVKNQTYSGKAKTPSLTVKHGSKTLKLGIDYIVKHSTRKFVGKATITIIGKGNYVGTKTVTFKILPKKTSVSKLTVGKKQIKATWKKVSGTTKYEVRYRVKGSNKWETKSVSGKTNSLKITKLKKGKTYQVQVRSYKTVSRAKYYSAWSATKTSKKVK
jgi:hypothetical protein